jgi:hypothetical protein
MSCNQRTVWVGGKPVFAGGQIAIHTGLANELFVSQQFAAGWEIFKKQGTGWVRVGYDVRRYTLGRRFYGKPSVLALPLALPLVKGGVYAVKLQLSWTQGGVTKTRFNGWLRNPVTGRSDCTFR